LPVIGLDDLVQQYPFHSLSVVPVNQSDYSPSAALSRP
jgi:hypothetical protein